VVTDRPPDAARVLRGLGLTDVVIEPGVAVATLGSFAAEKVVVALVQDGVPVTGFAVERPSLEDLFVSLTGEGFNVSG
jgi:ABC-2 type transport system ATP-binding protein